MRRLGRKALLLLALPAALVATGCSSDGLRLETYNIAHLSHGSLSQVAGDISASNADIVAIQETKQTDGQESDPHALAHKLGWDADGKRHSWFAGWHDSNPSTNWCNGTSCTEGNGIISRFPIVNYGSAPLYYETGLHRNLIWADVELAQGADVRVYAMHLAHSTADYDIKQLNGALLYITQNYPQNPPAVLMGDLNLPLDHHDYYDLQAFDALNSQGFRDWKVSRVLEVDPNLANVCHDTNANGSIAPCTYPNPTPSDKRDYVWVKGLSLNAGLVRNNCPNGNCVSDHRPYWTDVGPPGG